MLFCNIELLNNHIKFQNNYQFQILRYFVHPSFYSSQKLEISHNSSPNHFIVLVQANSLELLQIEPTKIDIIERIKIKIKELINKIIIFINQ